MAYDLRMAFWDPVKPSHVRQAVAEYDKLGQDEFLARHGFGRATAYLLILDGKSYDWNASCGTCGIPLARRSVPMLPSAAPGSWTAEP
jgi:hypothetical protein